MELLIAQRLTLVVGGTELLAGVNLRLAVGERIGLVGPNGSGKSTLLRVLAGLEEPDSGRLWRAPGVRVGHLPQPGAEHASDETVWQAASRSLSLVRELEERMRELEQLADHGPQADEYTRLQAEFERAGGFGAEALLRRELAAVGFGAADDQRAVNQLSSGEQRRLALASALAAAPDILLLDEPTNHLDLAARVRLGRRLAAWDGALIVVSHDRALLDESTNRTAFIEPHGTDDGGPSRLVLEPGAYSAANVRRQGALRASHKRERERAKEAARLEAMAAELAHFGRKANARKRAAERELSGLRAHNLTGTGSKRSRELPQLAALPVLGSRAQRGKRSDRTLLEATALSRPPMIDAVDLSVRRGDRVALLGPNGSGKSTLLALLSGELPSADPSAQLRFADGLKLRRIGQESRGLADGQPLWDQVTERVGTVHAGKLLADAGLPPRSWNSLPAALSGGERARAGLALALAEEADVWVIDEPTNDLDLSAVEALETQLLSKLESSGAALLLATHDRRLAQRLTEEVWTLESGALVRYASVDAYVAGERLATSEVESEQEEERTFAPPNASSAAGSVTGPGEPPLPLSVDPADLLAELEERRAELLRLRDEESGLTERDRVRVQALLSEVEEELMASYSARLPAPAPSYRLVESGLTLYAERFEQAGAPPDEPHAQRSQTLLVVAPHAAALGTAHSQGGAAIAAELFAAFTQGAGLLDPDTLLGERSAAWLEVRLLSGVGHLRLVTGTRACVLPYVKAALANAGARLAFTRLGATAVQLHLQELRHESELPSMLLRPAGDGWWSLGLGQFLEADGWRK